MTFMFFMVIGCTGGSGTDEIEEPTVVETATARIGSIEQTINLSGDVVAGKSVRLFGQIPDRLTSVLVDVGDSVQRGQVLARIRDEGVQASVDQIEANLRATQVTLANLRDEYTRSQRLFEAGAVSSQTLEGLRTRLEATEAQEEQFQAVLTAAQASFQNATISAPFDGVIAERYMEAGDLAGPGFPVFRIVNMDMVKVETDISQEWLGQVHLGMPTRVMVSSYPGETFTGDVINIAPVLDPMTRMIRIEIGIENRDERLKAGMFAQIQLIVAATNDALVIPIDALLDEFLYVANASLLQYGIAGGEGIPVEAEVYIPEGGIARLQKVRIGVIGSETVQILEGLSEGNLVITTGRYQLTDGRSIRITESNGTAGSERENEGGDR